MLHSCAWEPYFEARYLRMLLVMKVLGFLERGRCCVHTVAFDMSYGTLPLEGCVGEEMKVSGRRKEATLLLYMCG